jgi:excisionase family DNA binding protein
MKKRFLSIGEVARYLNLSQSAIRLWISQGRLHCLRAGRRVLFDRKYIEQRSASGQMLEPVRTAKSVPKRKRERRNLEKGQMCFPFMND